MAAQKRDWRADILAVLALGPLLLGTGCQGFFVPESSSSGGGTTSGGDYVYVANQTTGTLAAYSVGSGALTVISGSPYSLGFAPTAVAVNPANTIVFVAGVSNGVGFIDAFSIASNGGLSLLTQNNVLLADPISMDVSPDGQWLVGLDGNGLTIDEYQINSSSGQLTLATGWAYSNVPLTTPRSLKISPNGNFVFAAIDTSGDLVFPFNTTNGVLSTPGTLTLPSQVGDNALAVSPNSGYLYIARSSGTGGSLAVYTVSSAGVLTPISGSPFAAGSQPFSVVVSSDGARVYLANQLDSTISGYSIASNGTATAISGSPYSNTSPPSGLVIDKSGKYLLAISSAGSPDLSLYSFDSTTIGKLNLVTSTSTGKDPTGPIAIAATH